MRERRKISRDTLAGTLLLAHPSMRDPNFRRSVVLMSAHNAEGAMGVVLNRPLHKRLGELSGEFALGPLASVPLVLSAWRSGVFWLVVYAVALTLRVRAEEAAMHEQLGDRWAAYCRRTGAFFPRW